LKYIFGFITAVSLILLAAFVSLRLESVQHTLAKKVSEELSASYGVPTEITAIEIYSINEIRLKGVLVKDLREDTLLHANEAQAHLNTAQLFDGLIRINTIGLGAPDIRLNRATAGAPLNAQFIIDIINGKKKKDKNPKIDLQINQVSIYDGKAAYDILDTATDSTMFDKNHIAVKGLDCNISLKKLNSEELELDVRSIHAEERCGFTLKELSGRVEMREKILHLNGVDIKTGKSHISSENISIDLNNGLKDVSMQGNVKCHVLSPDDYAPFTDVQLRILPAISFNADGFYCKDSINAAITARTHSNDFNIKGHAALKAPLSSTRKGEVVIEECNASNDIVKQVIDFAGLKDIGYDIPGKLGDIFTNGMLTFHSDSINGDIELACKSGHFFVNGMVDTLGTYRAHINGMDLQLYDLTEIQSLRRCDITADMSGNWNDADNLLNVDAIVNDLVFNDYTYSPIVLQGEYNRNSITANISTDDPNVSLLADATYNRNSNKKLKLMLTAGTFRPKRLNLIKTDKEQDFAFTLVGDYFDQGDGSRIINANINNLKYADEADTTYVNNIFFSDSKSTDERLFVLSSDFAQASIYGHFDVPSMLNSFVGLLTSQLPVLGVEPSSTDDREHENSFYYDISITDGKPLAHFLDIPIAINEESKIKGMFDDRERQFSIDARINNLAFGGRRFRSLSIDGKSSDKNVDLKAQILKPTVTDPKTFKYEDTTDDVVIRLNANICKDMVKSVVNWNNFKKDEPLMGMVRVDAGLFRDDNGELNLEAKIHNDSIIHNNQTWHITEGSISGNTNRLSAKNISLYNDEQSLCIEGIVGKSASDSLSVDVKNFELATIFEIINFKILSFGGKATGTAHVTGLLYAPNAGGRFEVEGFKIDGGKMGRGDIYAGWDNKTKSIVLDADVYNEANAKSNVSGFLSQANDTITLMIDANDLNLNFLNKKLKSFVVNTRGTATGKVHLHGSWRAVDFDGAAAMHCSTTVNSDTFDVAIGESVDGGTVSGYGWANTGLAFVPADYEDRIIDLENKTANHEIRIKLLEANEDEKGVPSYWLSELETKADTIQQAVETAGRNKSAFLWYTDAHWTSSAKMSPALLKYLAKNTPINKVNFGGDIVGDPSSFTHDNVKYVYEWRKLIADLPNHHSVYGNHDVNHRSTDVSNMAYAYMLAPEESPDMVVGGDGYYYIDNPSEKTRYLYLSYLTSDHNAMTAQGQFIVNALLGVNEGWHIVAIAHRWFQYTSSSAPTVGAVPSYEKEILKIFDEYNARTSHTASNYFASQSFASGKGKVEFCIGGHIHVDYDFNTDGGIPVIITASDTNQERASGETEDSGTVGTTTESAVFGIVADYNNNKITVVGVGRGGSREVSY
jgi:hypothetical protein